MVYCKDKKLNENCPYILNGECMYFDACSEQTAIKPQPMSVCQWCKAPATVEKDDKYTTFTCTKCKVVGVLS